MIVSTSSTPLHLTSELYKNSINQNYFKYNYCIIYHVKRGKYRLLHLSAMLGSNWNDNVVKCLNSIKVYEKPGYVDFILEQYLKHPEIYSVFTTFGELGSIEPFNIKETFPELLF